MMRKSAHIAIGFLLCIIVYNGYSQIKATKTNAANINLSASKPSFKITSNKNSILLGEQFELNIELSIPVNARLKKWPSIPDTGQHLEVISRGLVDSILSKDFRKYRQTIIMTGFDSGRWNIPQLTYLLDKEFLQSNTLQIDVLPVTLKGNEYYDIHEIVEVKKPSFQWWKIWFSVIVILLTSFFYYMWRKRKVVFQLISEKGQDKGSYEQAIIQMNKLKSENLIEKGEMKKFYIRLYDILRVYISVKYTDDMVLKIASSLDKEDASRGIQGLRVCEAVKFAKYASSPSEADNVWRTFYRVLELLNSKNSVK